MRRQCPGGRACSRPRSTTCCCAARPRTRCYRRRRRRSSSSLLLLLRSSCVRSSAASTWAHLLLANLDDLLVATCREPAVAATAATVYYASEPTRRSRTHTRSRGAAVEPRERDEPRKPTTCVSGRLIRSCATRHVSGRGLTVDGVDRGSTQFFSDYQHQPLSTT
jgi:hypothetical protein